MSEVAPRPSLMAVYRKLQDQLLDHVGAAGDPLPSFGMGEADLQNNQKLPRITWMPMGGPSSGAVSKASTCAVLNNPRALWVRAFATQAHVRAAGIDETNLLMNHVVAALDAINHGSYKIAGEAWAVTGSTDPKRSDRCDGLTAVLTFVVDIPFVDESGSVATLQSAPTTRELDPQEAP